jgi:hypothetical protein
LFVRLCRSPQVLSLPLRKRLTLDPLAAAQDRLPSAAVHVGWRHVTERLVVAPVAALARSSVSVTSAAPIVADRFYARILRE